LVTFYPNPVKDELRLNLSESIEGSAEVSIFDLTGRKWYTAHMASGNLLINVSALTSGTYLIQVKAGQLGLINRRFLKI